MVFDKIKEAFGQVGHSRAAEPIPISGDDYGKITSLQQLYRYRYNYAVNLGSLFVLESWIYGDLFDYGGGSEFEAVKNQLGRHPANEVGQKLASHYGNYLNQMDWNWLKNEANITSLRVPIGYWHVGNACFTDNTPFESLKEVYANARPWDYLLKLISTAQQYNIGILIDMHGLPGGSNADSHSGLIEPNPSFFSTQHYVDLMIQQVFPFIVSNVNPQFSNIIGLQVVNEAAFDNGGTNQKKYYSAAIRAITSMDPLLPVVISDGWWPDQFADWLQQSRLQEQCIIDSHVYRCFSDEDKSKLPEQIIQDLKSYSLPKDKADFMVGEFSCVFDESSWKKTNADHEQIVHDFGNTQISVFNNNASWGWFFWTLQFQHGDGGEWGFVPQTNKSNIPRRPAQSLNVIDWGKVDNLIQQHVNYWADKGSDSFEHWRYVDGIKTATSDVEQFANWDNSRIGRWYAWTQMRRKQYILLKGDSKYMWEWDQGYNIALQEFNHY